MGTTGGAAFPVTPPLDRFDNCSGYYPGPEAGMSLRDYFAAKAMQGMVINQVDATNEVLAARSYVVADAMLKVRRY